MVLELKVGAGSALLLVVFYLQNGKADRKKKKGILWIILFGISEKIKQLIKVIGCFIISIIDANNSNSISLKLFFFPLV